MGHNKIRVVVKAYPAGPGYRFEMWNEGGSQITDETIVFEKPLTGSNKLKKVHHHRVYFRLENKSTSLKFANQDNAFFIDGVGGNPSKGKHLDAFWVDKRTSDTMIEVINMNLKPKIYKFTLNFVPDTSVDNGGPYIEYDPIGDNRNGGGPGSDLWFNSLSVAGGLTGGIVGIGASALANNAFSMDALAFGFAGAVVGMLIGFLLDRL